MLSTNKSSLLNYAFSRLTPEIFSHPIWLRFGKENTSPPNIQIVNDLILAAKELQDEEPGIACQILLLCAVYQNNAAQSVEAISTIQKVQILAQHTCLVKEMIWAMWGEAAIYIRQGNHEQACEILANLQAALTEQNEWMLAGFIDILRQDFCKSTTNRDEQVSQQLHGQQSGELQTFTFEWLQQWGCSFKSTEMKLESLSRPHAGHQATHTASIRSFLSIQKWLGRWQSFKLAVQGELKLQWTAKHVPSVKEPDPFWNSKINSPELLQLVQHVDRPARDKSDPTPKNILLPPNDDHLPVKAQASESKPTLGHEKVEIKRQPKPENTTIPVAVHMLGDFTMTIGDKSVKLVSSKGLSVLKYLLLHHGRIITRDVLMDTFWPDAGMETARNNLNVAMHSLRKSLRSTLFLPVIKFEDGAYGLEPNLQLWLDVDEFQKCVSAGQQLEARGKLTDAVAEYEAAVSLYQGDLLEQNPYEEWTVLERERLRITYLDILDRLSQIYFNQEHYAACITICQLLLTRDRCREDAHCLLMRCYSRQGQDHLALRQYQICIGALRDELDVEPGPATDQLANRIRRHEHI